MREIKFRAWNKEQKKMLPVLSIVWSECTSGQFIITVHAGTGEESISYLDESSLMQFTGLHDKNGKSNEVYDSDIIYDGWHKCNRKVVFEDGCYYADRIVSKRDGWSNRLTLSEVLIDPNSRVIGNIYENPELLTKGAKG